ncbi:MAG: hypothetical protein ACI9SP_004635 [Arenicella sp.]|jgi:hypothetical protein
MKLFHYASRPVLFESDEYYHGFGSSVLISTSKNCYWVTAQHVIDNQSQKPENLRIYPAEKSRISIPFDQCIVIREDDDYSDLCILRIDSALFNKTGDKEIVSQALENGLLNPNDLNLGDRLYVVGFPLDGREVDYESYKIKYRQSDFNANYIGSSSMKHCHEIRFDQNHGLDDFNGLSGSPVYKLLSSNNVLKVMLVGILLRGTVSSSIAHFVGADVLRHAILESEK